MDELQLLYNENINKTPIETPHRSKAEIILISSKYNKHPILYSCKRDNLVIFKLLSKLEKQNIGDIVDTGKQVGSMVTILGVIARNRSNKIAKYLLTDNHIYSSTINIHKKACIGAYTGRYTPLIEAALAWNDIMIQLLLNHPSMTAKHLQNTYPLHYTIAKHKEMTSTTCWIKVEDFTDEKQRRLKKCILLLLDDKRIDANEYNQHGITPLGIALSSEKCKKFPTQILLTLINSPRVDVSIICSLWVDDNNKNSTGFGWSNMNRSQRKVQCTPLEIAKMYQYDDEIIQAIQNRSVKGLRCQKEKRESLTLK